MAAMNASTPPLLTNSERRHQRIGIGFVLGAAVLWSLNGALIKLIHADGAGPSALAIAFYRSLIAGVVLLPLGRGRYATLCTPAMDGSPRRAFSVRAIRRDAVVCVVFFALMTVCFVAANTMTQAANAIILQYTSTFWIFGLSPLLLQERPNRGAVGVLVLAMVGVAVIFAGNATTSLPGLAVALASGLTYGVLTMMIRRLRRADSAALTVLNNLGSALLILPVLLLAGDLGVGWRDLAYLVFMGVVQFGVPYYLFSLGLQRVPAYHVGLLTLVEPVLVPVWVYAVVGERVPAATLSGGAVILCALVLYGVRGRTHAAGNARR